MIVVLLIVAWLAGPSPIPKTFAQLFPDMESCLNAMQEVAPHFQTPAVNKFTMGCVPVDVPEDEQHNG